MSQTHKAFRHWRSQSTLHTLQYLQLQQQKQTSQTLSAIYQLGQTQSSLTEETKSVAVTKQTQKQLCRRNLANTLSRFHFVKAKTAFLKWQDYCSLQQHRCQILSKVSYKQTKNYLRIAITMLQNWVQTSALAKVKLQIKHMEVRCEDQLRANQHSRNQAEHSSSLTELTFHHNKASF